MFCEGPCACIFALHGHGDTSAGFLSTAPVHFHRAICLEIDACPYPFLIPGSLHSSSIGMDHKMYVFVRVGLLGTVDMQGIRNV